VLRAAELYGEVAQGRSSVAAQGATGLRGLLDAALLKPLPPADAARVFAQVQAARTAGQPAGTAKEAVALGWSLIEVHTAQDPAGAKALLDAIAPIEMDKARLSQAAEPLLDRIVAADPKNAPAALELAELLDGRRDCTRCEALLAPHAAVLGHGEGARILGRIYAARGMLDESYALLQPYTEEKLRRFVKQEAEYTQLVERTEKGVIETLRSGGGPAEFYKRYDAADEAGKREMVSTYLNEQLSANTALKSQLQALRASAAIVPVALDLGIVTVQRAQKLDDAQARNLQFQAAEKVFLSIRGVAGDNDDYRLYLGQVYYWLGKQDEGRKLFDELLASHGREHGVVLNVASVLRSIGAMQDARALAEEAYDKASDKAQRWDAATLRSVMFVDPEDQLLWLERSDPSVSRVRAQIHTTRGHLAERKGQRDVARREFELALGEYAKQPESAAQLNNSALVHLAVYGMDGDAGHRDQGLAQLDQALALMPSDSTLLLNNISAVRSAAAAALLGERIDLPLLRVPGELTELAYLHQDEASRDRVRAQLRTDAAVKKGLAYAEKATLLAPRNPESYIFPLAVAALLEDTATLKTLAARARDSRLDLGDLQSQMQKIVEGADAKQRVQGMAAQAGQLGAALKQPALQRLPASWALGAGRWVNAQIMLARWGVAIDADDLVNTARKAYAGQASSGSLSALLDALEARAVLRLAKADASFADDLAKHGRAIDFLALLGVHLDEDPAFRRLALADADLAEVRSLVRERDRRYPTHASPWAWLLFRHVDAGYAQVQATRLRADPAYAAYLEVRSVFEPRQADAAIQRYQVALAGGDRAGAQRVLDETRRAGIALPELLGRQLKE